MCDPFVIVPVSRYAMADNVVGNIRRQNHRHRPIVVEVGHARGQVQKRLGVAEYVTCWTATPGQARNLGVARAMRLDPEAPVIFMDDDDWYGPGYVRDQLSTLDDHQEAIWVAKPQVFVESAGTLYCIDRDAQHRKNGVAPGGTIAVRRARDCLAFPGLPVGEDTAWRHDMVAANRHGWTGSGRQYLYRIHGLNTSHVTLPLVIASAHTEAIEVGPVDHLVVTGVIEVTGRRVGPDYENVFAALARWDAETAREGLGPMTRG